MRVLLPVVAVAAAIAGLAFLRSPSAPAAAPAPPPALRSPGSAPGEPQDGEGGPKPDPRDERLAALEAENARLREREAQMENPLNRETAEKLTRTIDARFEDLRVTMHMSHVSPQPAAHGREPVNAWRTSRRSRARAPA